MHVVGVGSGVNRALAASLARAGRGAEVLVSLGDDAEKSAKSLVDKTRAPVLTDVTISGEAFIDGSPEHVPDVFAGSPVLAALQVRPSGGELVVRGKLARGVWEQRIRVAASDPGDGNPAVVKLYGRERVADLEMRWSIGNEVQAIDREIESIGLVFQIATRRTSWVAIDDDRSVDPRRGTRHEEIPQEVPYGTTMASFGAPMPAMAQSYVTLAAPAPAMMISSLRSMAKEEDAAPMRPRGAAAPGFGAPRPAASVPTVRPPSMAEEGTAGDDTDGEEATMVTGSHAIPHAHDTLRMPPMPAESAPPAQAIAERPAAPPAQAIAERPAAPPAPSKSSRTLLAIIAALVALVLVLAAIVAWLLYTR